jgi:hypothetical protein
MRCYDSRWDSLRQLSVKTSNVVCVFSLEDFKQIREVKKVDKLL